MGTRVPHSRGHTAETSQAGGNATLWTSSPPEKLNSAPKQFFNALLARNRVGAPDFGIGAIILEKDCYE